MKTEISERDKGFMQGYMCACANLINMNGLGTREEELFKTFGIVDIKRLKDNEVDPADIKTFKSHKLI